MNALRGILMAASLAGGFGALLLLSVPAVAGTVDPLALQLGNYPDIKSNVSVTYGSSATGFLMSVSGSNEEVGLPLGTDRSTLGTSASIFPFAGVADDFSLSADFDATGNFLGGSFAITGVALDTFPSTLDDAVDDPNSGSNLAGTLLSGALIEFGAQQRTGPGAAGTLQFRVSVDRSSPLAFYGDSSLLSDGFVEITLTNEDGTPVDWAADLTTTPFTGSGFSNTLVTPLPGGLLLFSSALVAFVTLRWRRRGD